MAAGRRGAARRGVAPEGLSGRRGSSLAASSPGFLCSSWTAHVRSSPHPGPPIPGPVFLGKKAWREAPRLLAQAQSGLASWCLSWPSLSGKGKEQTFSGCLSVSFIARKVLTPYSSVWAPQPPAPAAVSVPEPGALRVRTALKERSTYGTGGGYVLCTN